ncbi:MAG: TrkH family potassium uptake protein [Geminicoccaceae bacterium]
MADVTEIQRLGKKLKRSAAGARITLLRMEPAKLLLIGYLSYMVVGWGLLSLPFAQVEPLKAIDNLFIASSAVSTTGLVVVDPGTSYTLFGEIVIIILIQIGGLGYMTISSFAVLALQDRLNRVLEHTVRATFSLPEGIEVGSFIKSVVFFTLITEILGAILLLPFFIAKDVANPVWSAIFHSISAFCTAGFSLNPNSFEDFRSSFGVNAIISALSLLGAMGFLIVLDSWRTITSQKRFLGFTSKVIFRITLVFLVLGTSLLFVADPQIRALPQEERFLASFFQTMTASTTVGFNTYPISAVSHSVLVVLLFLMVIGASPAGTGGGLKTTSFAALVGLVRSTLKGRDKIRFFKREVPLTRLQTATTSLAFYAALLTASLFFLFLTEKEAEFDYVLFEAVSAMGTVGLSMGLTGDLSFFGKVIIITLMVAGRVGILTFGIALATHDESREEEEDNELIM